MVNADIRNTAKEANIKLWQIAEELGIADCNFSRKLRKELSEDKKQQIIAIIHRLKKEEVSI